MSQPDWEKSGMGGGNPHRYQVQAPDVLIGWYCGTSTMPGNAYRFALDRTADRPDQATCGTGLSDAFEGRGTWYGFVDNIAPLRQNVGPSIHSKLFFSSVVIRIKRADHRIIDSLISDIESTEGFSNATYLVSIMIAARDKALDPDTDTFFVGQIEPRSCKVFPDRIEITLCDQGKALLEQNVLEEYKVADYPDVEDNWVDKPIPRMYGEWGDDGAGYHNQYGFEVPIINSTAVHDDDNTGWNWPIFRICDPGELDFTMDQSTGLPDMADEYPKVWAFWGDDTSYDIWQVRQCDDQVTYPLADGYVQAVKSIREEHSSYEVWDSGIASISLPSGSPIVVTLLDWNAILGHGTYIAGNRILFQDVVGTTELNQEWWYVFSAVNSGGLATAYTLYKKDGTTQTDGDDFTPFISGGLITNYVPIYKPYEAAGSRDTETEPFLFWVQDGANKTFSIESDKNPGNPMTNPVEIIYDLIVNVAGESSSNVSSQWWSAYATLDGQNVKARRFIKEQTTIKKIIEELLHDFGLMVYKHAGTWYCELNRVWPRASTYIDKQFYPKDRAVGSYSEPEDPAGEAILSDHGVLLFYQWDQEGQVFSGSKMSSINQQFSATQSPKSVISVMGTPNLGGEEFYKMYRYPPATTAAQSHIIESRWIYDTDTAELMCLLFASALNANLSLSVGNTGVKTKIIKRIMDPSYRLGDIYRFWDSTCEPTESRDAQVYERVVDFALFQIEVSCYEVRITGE